MNTPMCCDEATYTRSFPSADPESSYHRPDPYMGAHAYRFHWRQGAVDSGRGGSSKDRRRIMTWRQKRAFERRYAQHHNHSAREGAMVCDVCNPDYRF